MNAIDDLPVLAFADAEAFESWLEANARSRGAWLKFARKGGAATTLSKKDAIDAALCHGWIDGQLGRGDENCFLTRFTPRKAGGRWSANNAKRAEELIALGRMRRAGLAEIEAAKADGRWQAAYPGASAAAIPDDFQAALSRNARAAAAFAALDGANRYAVLYRLHHAKAPQRAQRIADLVAMLARGETYHEPRKPRPRQRAATAKPGVGGKVTPS